MESKGLIMVDELSLFEALLQKYLGENRLLIFDIGARGGLHSRWNKFLSVIEVLGFEPEKAECERLNALARTLSYKARFLPYALGRENASAVKFYVCRKPGCSSIYEPNLMFAQDFTPASSMQVETVSTLDTVQLADIAAKEQLQSDVMKIDVQGAELDVLLGGSNLLGGTKLVELEVEFNPQYINQPLFHDVDKYMHGVGWNLLGLRRTYWRRKNGLSIETDGCGGHLIHGDAIYFNARFVEKMDVGIEDLLKVLLVLSAYRQNDLVLSILSSQCPALRVLSGEERALLQQHLVHYPSRIARLFRWMLRGINHREKRRLIDLLQEGNAVDWHDSDFY